MSDDNSNKRSASEQNVLEDDATIGTSKSFKVAVISSSLNTDNIVENSIVSRTNLSKVIIKVKSSPTRKTFLNGENISMTSFEEDMVENISENNHSKEDQANLSQKIIDTFLVKNKT